MAETLMLYSYCPRCTGKPPDVGMRLCVLHRRSTRELAVAPEQFDEPIPLPIEAIPPSRGPLSHVAWLEKQWHKSVEYRERRKAKNRVEQCGYANEEEIREEMEGYEAAKAHRETVVVPKRLSGDSIGSDGPDRWHILATGCRRVMPKPSLSMLDQNWWS